MKNKPFVQALAAILLYGIAAGASAISVTADLSGATIRVGDEITLTITGDFQDDPTLGGGLNFSWDTAVLDLVSWDPLDWGGDADYFFEGFVDEGAGTISSFASGHFDGISGPIVMATITLLAIDTGQTLTMNDDFGGPAGRFTSAVNFLPQTVDFGPHNAAGLLTVQNVPLPAAAWLLIGGLGALLGFRSSNTSEGK